MGKGTIAGGGTDGLYSVTLDYGSAAKTERLAAMDARLAVLVSSITDAQAAYDAQLAAEDAQKALVNDTINAYVEASTAVGAALQAVIDAQEDVADGVEGAQAALDAANAAYAAAQAAVPEALQAYTDAATELVQIKSDTAKLRIPLDTLNAEQAQLTKDRAKWDGLALTETVIAWCADLTEDASGEVATIEVPGENALVLIAPAAPAPTALDGLLTAREVQSPAQVFWNACVLPGWQKWRPTYRRGTITALDLDNDTADVTLTGDVSSAQGLGINQADTLASVPVVYMTCNAHAFEVGDTCVVQFTGQDWAAPKVVGFTANPKNCFNVRVITAPFQSVQVYLDPEMPQRVSDAELWAAVAANSVTIEVKNAGGAWETLSLWIAPDPDPSTRTYRNSLGQNAVLIWEPRSYTFDKPVIIIYSPIWPVGAHYGRVVMADGKTAASWGFNYDGYLVYMRPLKLVNPADLTWTPSLDRMREWV